jgi:sortase (surface protein transpeptidase)
VKRTLAWAIPLLLAVVGVVLIAIGLQGGGEEPTASLAPIPAASESAVAAAPSATASAPSRAPSISATPVPTPSPLPDDVVAQQLEVPQVGVNVEIRQSQDDATDNFPPRDAAYILQGSSQPGRNTNSYIFAHATESLFKPLWNVQLGAEVRILMSDGSVLQYVVTEVRPNVPCPDPDADPAMNPPDPPLALQLHTTCDEGIYWLQPTAHERITLQTSQGFNRNWGEFVVVAEPAG